ncbi:RagB/SusD family nutrient uptake outer membrane protein [Arachidicoccus soli]|uniref:RagB/SusD family nutrient uptake outer membrane protein n=1 Tax=Arachidicoccus soli TaxID=2341117 RepID=A0A386HT52_9BACT|nr:RagB/SusD family nutrient uptake outer membrane protein [Arachidicoccus soli]AYD48464.1 RagB/SusD family nutrient uptake outer membrane protein [Arachidicoccus soli]
MKIYFKYKKWCSYLLVILSINIMLSSCKKYLDKKSNSSLVTPSTLSDLQALLDDAATMNQQRTPCYGEASSDEYFLPLSAFNALNDGDQKRYTWREYFFGSGNDWAACYQPIYNANLVLDLIKNIPQTSLNKVAWNNVKGSALFYRSYYFLCLLWNYAKAYDSTTANKDLGIALRLTSNFNVKSTRATNLQCYQQVIEDTKASIALLPAYPQHVMRPSKDAAYGLLARCYLSMRDYKNALLFSDSCLQLNNQLMDYNNDPDIPKGITASAPFHQFNKETIFYTEINTYFYFYLTSISSRIDTALIQLYNQNDLRRLAYYSSNSDGYKTFKGAYTNSLYSMFSGMATDELYLTRAECYIRNGQLQQGLNDLNTLLAKRYQTGAFVAYTVSMGQTAALNLVLQEREKELVMRGMRWMDLKRLNKEGANITIKREEGDQTYTLEPNANFYALPIPEDIIKLTGMQQNDL